MSRSYQHIFFDLDRTLWDFDTNSHQALLEIGDECRLCDRGIDDMAAFILRYQQINEHYWSLYRQQKLDKATLRWIRFSKTLEEFGVIDSELADQLAEKYIKVSPLKTALLPGAIDTLDHLAGRYQLHIITNGFEEVQHLKLNSSGLTPYFDVIVTSEGAGHKKPKREIFDYACQMTGANIRESMMIGDDLEADICGAQNAGMDHVFFNPKAAVHEFAVTHEVKSLLQLRDIL